MESSVALSLEISSWVSGEIRVTYAEEGFCMNPALLEDTRDSTQRQGRGEQAGATLVFPKLLVYD